MYMYRERERERDIHRKAVGGPLVDFASQLMGPNVKANVYIYIYIYI